MSPHKFNFGEVDRLTITTLIEDYSGYDSPYLGHHGIALLIEVVIGKESKRILLDVGQAANPILHNMEILGISPKSIDAIVLSHCHFDHTKGLIGILKQIDRKIPVIAHPDIFRENYTYDSDQNIGITDENSREKILKSGGLLQLTKEPFKITTGVFTTGEVERITEFEREEPFSYNLVQGRRVPDEIMDDISIVANVKGKGLFVATGCSHAGVINILRHSAKITGIEKIYGIIGGFHLISSSDDRINDTVSSLVEMDLQVIVPGHCTGFNALYKLSKQFKEKFIRLHSGKKITIG